MIGELPHLDEHLLVRSDLGETKRWTPHAITYLLTKLAAMAAGFAATTRLSAATDWPPRPPDPQTGPVLTN